VVVFELSPPKPALNNMLQVCSNVNFVCIKGHFKVQNAKYRATVVLKLQAFHLSEPQI
jgi:hypothetical protein